MRNIAAPVQFIVVAARLVNNTDTHTQYLSYNKQAVAPPPPPPPPKTDTPSHRAPGGVKNSSFNGRNHFRTSIA